MWRDAMASYNGSLLFFFFFILLLPSHFSPFLPRFPQHLPRLRARLLPDTHLLGPARRCLDPETKRVGQEVGKEKRRIDS